MNILKIIDFLIFKLKILTLKLQALVENKKQFDFLRSLKQNCVFIHSGPFNVLLSVKIFILKILVNKW